ncbi:MAG: glycoside hydrolase family 18 protein [Terriglobales bacterium]
MYFRRGFFLKFSAWILAGLMLPSVVTLSFAQSGGEDQQNVAPSKRMPKRLVADYGYWSKSQTPPYSSDQIPFEKITAVNHAGVSINTDGTIAVPEGLLEPKLIRRAHKAGVKVLILLGGDGGVFSSVAADPGLRATLVGSLSTFITENHYDGVDVDWEFPGSPEDKDNFGELMLEMRQALPSPTYLLSVDAGPWGGSDTPFKRLAKQIDYFNIMMYDCAGPWTADAQLNSPIFWDHSDPDPSECQPGGSADGAMDIYLNKLHLSPDQLNMGTPFYGYWYKTVKGLFKRCPGADPNTDTDCPDGTVLAESYGNFIKQRVNRKGWVRQYDLVALVPYLVKADGSRGFITYDDGFSTYLRVWHSVWDRGLGGTFMWSVDQDYDGHSQDLLDAMHSAILEGGP